MPQSTPTRSFAAASTAGALRTALLGLFLLGSLGTAAELLLIGHVEDNWQLVPLGLFAVAPVLIAWYALARSSASIRAFQGLMFLYIGAGVAGSLLHYLGNMEFELEMYPGMAGLELFRETMTGAFPALAPGAMTLFGLIGLAWIDVESSMDFDRLIEIRPRGFLHETRPFGRSMKLVFLDLGDRLGLFLSDFSHLFNSLWCDRGSPLPHNDSLSRDFDTHRTGCAFDLADGAIKIDRVQVLHLEFSDFINLRFGHTSDLIPRRMT